MPSLTQTEWERWLHQVVSVQMTARTLMQGLPYTAEMWKRGQGGFLLSAATTAGILLRLMAV